MIRAITPADSAAIVNVCYGSGLFPLEEMHAVREMLESYHSTSTGDGSQISVYEADGVLAGVAYLAPRAFADRVWELLLIAVDGPCQRRGIGSRLLLAAEETVRRSRGRMLLIETSDRSSFERTRSFYRRHGYSEVARIPDYFADGDGKASFIKRV